MDSGGRKLIAVVDDEPGVRSGLGRLLRSAGYDAETFASGREWLAAPPEPRPDCLILDIRMPGIDGFELIDRMRAEGRELPVIILTSFPSELSRRRALEAGVEAFLTKPVERSTLVEALERALVGRLEP